jgi:uncharacterized protein (TIGR02145 family)/uncharacterized repeat protein (TIGR02543 family)
MSSSGDFDKVPTTCVLRVPDEASVSRYKAADGWKNFTTILPLNLTATFNSQDGSAVAAQSVNYNSTATTPTAPTRTGYAFGGWYKEAACTNAYAFATAVTANITLYAKWTVNTYSISYTLNGGTNHAGNPTSYTIESADITLQPPTRALHHFRGWSPDGGALPAGSMGNRTFTASWELYSYPVTFEALGGSSVAEQTVFHGSTAARPHDPVHRWSDFGGWYADPACTTPWDFYAPITAPTSIFAKWTVRPLVRRQPFTLLANNADQANRHLYAEVMYEPEACRSYLAMFTLTDRAGTPYGYLPIDSALNNAGTYRLSADRRQLAYPEAGGYRLRFALPEGASVADSLQLIVKSFTLPYLCRGCAAAGSDAYFEPMHLRDGCPPLPTLEPLACHRRKGRLANWEAWALDPRDCQPYRLVHLPDGRWWFAQNLRYGSADSLYTWQEAVTGSDTAPPFTLGSDYLGPQGVCPEGWHVPTDLEWHRLGVSLGSGAATPSDPWAQGVLPQLLTFRWYEAAPALRTANDATGFCWQPTPYEGERGIGGGAVRHGALWSAGSTEDDQRPEAPLSRMAAQATPTTWADSPLSVDSRAGSRTKDRLPLRCVSDTEAR